MHCSGKKKRFLNIITSSSKVAKRRQRDKTVGVKGRTLAWERSGGSGKEGQTRGDHREKGRVPRGRIL